MAETTTPERAVSVAEFRDTVGVNTHLSWIGTSYWNLEQVETALDQLGIDKVRDIIAPWSAENIDALGARGVEFTFIIGAEDIPFQLDAIENRAKIVDYVEGPNEIDNWPVAFDGKTGLAGAEALMSHLKTWIDASPTLGDDAADTPLAQVTFGHTDARDVRIDIKDLVDVGNSHSYAPYGWNPGRVLDDRIAGARVLAPDRPVITTEAGYHTALDAPDWTGVSEAVQARYTLTLLLEQFARGVDKTYLYELFDRDSAGSAADPENHFGLLRTDGTPKPAGAALGAMMATLGEAEAGLVPETLDHALSGLPDGADSLLMQRSDDTFVLAVWNDVPLWDDARDRAIAVAPSEVTLTLDQPAERIAVFDPVSGGRTPVAVAEDRASFSFALSDRPVLIEIVEAEDGPAANPRQGLRLNGTEQRDVLVGRDLDDTLIGGGGADVLSGRGGDDRLFGGAGNDRIGGGAGNDLLDGGDGADRLTGAAGDDRLTGGDGTDTFVFRSGDGADVITDFSAGDRIEVARGINGLSLSSASDLTGRLQDADGGAYLDLGQGNGVRLLDVTAQEAAQILEHQLLLV